MAMYKRVQKIFFFILTAYWIEIIPVLYVQNMAMNIPMSRKHFLVLPVGLKLVFIFYFHNMGMLRTYVPIYFSSFFISCFYFLFSCNWTNTLCI